MEIVWLFPIDTNDPNDFIVLKASKPLMPLNFCLLSNNNLKKIKLNQL